MSVVSSCTLKIRGGVERDSLGKKAGKGALIQWERSATLGANQDQTLFVWSEPMEYINFEYHPNDSRVRVEQNGICQTLTSRMGTGGGNVPLVLCFSKQRRAQNKDDFETWVESNISNTLNCFDLGDVRSTTVVCEADKKITSVNVKKGDE